MNINYSVSFIVREQRPRRGQWTVVPRGGRQTTEIWLRIDFFTLTTYFRPAESKSVVKTILSHQEVMLLDSYIVSLYFWTQNSLIRGRSGMYVWFSTDQAKSKNQFLYSIYECRMARGLSWAPLIRCVRISIRGLVPWSVGWGRVKKWKSCKKNEKWKHEKMKKQK